MCKTQYRNVLPSIIDAGEYTSAVHSWSSVSVGTSVLVNNGLFDRAKCVRKMQKVVNETAWVNYTTYFIQCIL